MTGDVVQDMCGQLVKEEAGRVVYKNYSFGVKIFKIVYDVCPPIYPRLPQFVPPNVWAEFDNKYCNMTGRF
jgi:hypothetical protein